MNADERRAEILAAEEAIRQLATEMARASESKALADQAGQALAAAREELGASARQLHDDLRAGEEALREVAGRLEETREQVARAATDMEKVARQVGELVSGVLDAIKQELAKGREESRDASARLQRLTWATLSVVLVTLVVGLVLLLLKTR